MDSQDVESLPEWAAEILENPAPTPEWFVNLREQYRNELGLYEAAVETPTVQPQSSNTSQQFNMAESETESAVKGLLEAHPDLIWHMDELPDELLETPRSIEAATDFTPIVDGDCQGVPIPSESSDIYDMDPQWADKFLDRCFDVDEVETVPSTSELPPTDTIAYESSKASPDATGVDANINADDVSVVNQASEGVVLLGRLMEMCPGIDWSNPKEAARQLLASIPSTLQNQTGGETATPLPIASASSVCHAGGEADVSGSDTHRTDVGSITPSPAACTSHAQQATTPNPITNTSVMLKPGTKRLVDYDDTDDTDDSDSDVPTGKRYKVDRRLRKGMYIILFLFYFTMSSLLLHLNLLCRKVTN